MLVPYSSPYRELEGNWESENNFSLFWFPHFLADDDQDEKWKYSCEQLSQSVAGEVEIIKAYTVDDSDMGNEEIICDSQIHGSEIIWPPPESCPTAIIEARFHSSPLLYLSEKSFSQEQVIKHAQESRIREVAEATMRHLAFRIAELYPVPARLPGELNA